MQIGSIVKLRSGSPDMLVVDLDDLSVGNPPVRLITAAYLAVDGQIQEFCRPAVMFRVVKEPLKGR